MKKKNTSYHIIGAGVAGLSCAYFLKLKDPSCKTIVYEAAGHPGGRCYSFDDKELQTRLDNATHVILGANKYAARLLFPHKWHNNCYFWNVQKDTIETDFRQFKTEIFKAMCNTAADEASKKIKNKIFWKLFPWGTKQRRIYFSQNDLSQRLINPLAVYADELHTDCKLLKLETQFGQIAQLNFNNRQVEINAGDKIILALDAVNTSRFLETPQFEFNGIINIFYHTSQPLSLPKGTSFLGIAEGLCDWIFVHGNITAVTISDVANHNEKLEDLARNIWKQLDTLRNVNSAFVPPFRVIHHKHATIKQDETNNAKRPQNAQTQYPNLFIAGDWTMKDYPCSIEAAILSGKRAAQAALKKR